MKQPHGLPPRPILMIDEDPQSRAIRIIELPAPQRPEKRRQSRQTERQGNGDEQEEPVHWTAQRSRSEFATTMSELEDMASAAMRGVTKPPIASGTAKTL